VTGDLQLQYYPQRAYDGALIIAKALRFPTRDTAGIRFGQGLWTDESACGMDTHHRDVHAQGARSVLLSCGRRPPGTISSTVKLK